MTITASMLAVYAFMDDLHLSRLEHRIYLEGEYKAPNSNAGMGIIRLCIEKRNPCDIPVISMEDHIMRGYGIPYYVFDVNKGQIIEWNPDSRILTFIGDTYRFSIIRIKKTES